MKTTLTSRALAVALALAAAGAAHGQSTFFVPVPLLPGGLTGNGNIASAVSGNGLYVVGASDSANSPAGSVTDGYIWAIDPTLSAQPVSIGTINPAAYNSVATGVSDSGSVVSGTSVETGTVSRAVQWVAPAGPLSNLGVAGSTTSANGRSFAYGVSGNGQWIVGATTTSTSVTVRAARYSAGSWQPLPPLPGSGGSFARAASFDGSVVVGDSAGVPFRWTAAGGTTPIPAIPGAGDNFGIALDVSADGGVVVGSMTSPQFTGDPPFSFPAPEAFRWEGGQTRRLGALTSSTTRTSSADAVRADGLVIVGSSRTGGTDAAPIDEAFIWTPRWGMSRLADRATDENGAPLVPAGVRLTGATGISNDGTVIVGNAVGATGNPFAYALKVRPYCVGDHNDQGGVELLDIFAFLTDWFNGDLKADANANGAADLLDIFFFLQHWFEGC